VTTPSATTVKVVLRVTSSQARRLGTGTIIGSATLTRTAGRHTIRVRLRRSAVRALKGRRSVALRVSARTAAGAPTAAPALTGTVVVRAARRS
jgi:hypothetical protein